METDLAERGLLYMELDLLHLWLGMFPDIMNMTMGKILAYFGGIQELWEAPEHEIRGALTEKQSGTILELRDEKKIIAYKNRLKERNITYIYPGHPYFPEILLNIPDCPRLLYAKGRVEELALNRPGIAVVGARKASAYGKETARLFVSKLAAYQTNIISGLAAGIDGVAQRAAVESEAGFTIAVLGCGINICYPRENYDLYERIERKGVILSEYGLDVEPAKWRFPLRNRIISGLAKGVLVVEAQKKSGSLITADQALEQGRDVYAVPGRVGDRNSEGCNQLIRQGATLVTDAMDIIDGLGLQKKEEIAHKKNAAGKEPPDFLEQEILICIGTEVVYIEDICSRIDQPPALVLSALFDMEKKGYIRQPMRYYFTAVSR